MQDSGDPSANIGTERATLQLGQSNRVGTAASSQQVSILTAPLIDLSLPRTFRRSALIAAAILLVMSILEVVAWALDIQELKHPTEEVALQSAAALNFLLIACSVITYYAGASGRLIRVVSKLMAVVVLIGAGATYIEHTFHLYWPNFVLCQPSDAFGLTYPGPLLPHESLGFVCVALAVLCLGRSIKKDYFPAQLLSIVVALPNLIVLCINLMGQKHLCIFFGCVKLSPITCLAFVISCYSIFFLIPESGLAAPFLLPTVVGIFARRILFYAVIFIVLLLPGLTILTLGWLDQGSTMLATALLEAIGFGMFLVWSLRKINRGANEVIQAIQTKDQEIELLHKEIQEKPQQQFKLVCLQCSQDFTDSGHTHCPNDNTELSRLVDGIKVGSIFAERYRIERELGAGGMSTVYLAHQLLMNKDVALKVLHASYASDAKTIQRFQREARATSSLSHPNLVTIYDFSVTETGQAYMVMEYLAGCSLGELLSSGKPVHWHQAVPLFLQICEGVDHAHRNNIIHRDLKPGNIMLLPSPFEKQNFQIKIVDFGIAKVLGEVNAQLTQTGEVFGSPLYMSPEQCQGQELDHRSDIYALGCIMYATLTGRAPFEGRNIMQTLSMHLSASPPAMPDVPRWLESCVHKCMSKAPDDRFNTAGQLAAALNSQSGE